MTDEQKAVVFGDPEQPLTVGAFVTWLESQFHEHDLRDQAQSLSIAKIDVAIRGNGDPHHGMEYKVDSMWGILQGIDGFLKTSGRIWAVVIGLLAAGAAAASIGHSFGAW